MHLEWGESTFRVLNTKIKGQNKIKTRDANLVIKFGFCSTGTSVSPLLSNNIILSLQKSGIIENP